MPALSVIDDRNETKRGMLWLGSATLVTRLIDVASSLIILVLLTREDIGTAALVLSTGAVVEAANGLGVGHALIQAKNRTKDEELSLFWLTCGIGLMLGLVLTVAAPFVARIYGLPVLSAMVAVTGLKMLLVGAALVPLQLLSARLMFREAGAAQGLATLGEALAKVSLAAIGFGAWATVLGNVFRGVVLLAAVLALSGFRPRLHFIWAETKAFLRFGSRVTATSLLYQSYRNADYFLVGKLLGVEALGIYRVAFDLGMQPMEIVINVINRVTYPIYVKLAHDLQALKNALIRSTRTMTLIAAPVVAFLVAAAPDLLSLVTHGRWGAAVPAIRILAWGALLRGAAHLFPQVYMAAGRPRYAIIDAATSLVVLVGAFWLGLTYLPHLGTLSVCWAWIAAYPGLLWVHLSLTRRITPIGTLEYIRSFAPGLGGALAMLACMAGVLLLGVREAGPLITVIVLAAIGLSAYATYLRLVLQMGIRDLVPEKQKVQA